jgi:hypothetical protein
VLIAAAHRDRRFVAFFQKDLLLFADVLLSPVIGNVSNAIARAALL